ncbi:MAG: transmembrane transport protein [Acidobacteriota bacterium]
MTSRTPHTASSATEMTRTNPSTPSTRSVDAVRALLERQLSTRSRIAHVVALLVDVAALGVVGSLWLTEPSLPFRTHVAFGLLVALGCAWAVYHLWVLTRRRPLDARQGLVAARLALSGCVVFTAGAGVVAWLERSPAALGAGVYGLLLIVVAVLLLERARRHREALELLRSSLERELGETTRRDPCTDMSTSS